MDFFCWNMWMNGYDPLWVLKRVLQLSIPAYRANSSLSYVLHLDLLSHGFPWTKHKLLSFTSRRVFDVFVINSKDVPSKSIIWHKFVEIFEKFDSLTMWISNILLKLYVIFLNICGFFVGTSIKFDSETVDWF